MKVKLVITVLVSLNLIVMVGCSEPKVSTVDDLSVPNATQPSAQTWGLDHDLIKAVAHSFYTHGSAYFGPGLPGWQSVSGAGRNGVWSAPEMLSNGRTAEEDSRFGSWLTGRAGSIRFPYPESTDAQTSLQFWFFGVSTGQAVSVFLNGEIVATVDLITGWGAYAVKLPALKSGEHRLRFWFRKTKMHNGKRTPGAIGQIRVGVGLTSAPWPSWNTMQRHIKLPSEDGDAWTYYLSDSAGAQVQAVVRTGETPAEAFITVTNDTGETTVVCSAKIEADSEVTLVGELPAIVEGAQRLTFKTSEHSHIVHWHSIVLRRRQSDQKLEVPSLLPKRMLFVVLDSVTDSSLRLGRKGAFPLTPTTDLLGRTGLALPLVFTGGDSLAQRIHRLLTWSLGMTTQRQERFRSALFSEVKFRLEDATRDQMDRDVVRSPDEFSQMLEEMEMWIKLGRSQPLSVTVVLSGHPNGEGSTPVMAVAENIEPPEHKPLPEKQVRRSTYLDQKLGRLIGLFAYLTDLEDTLVVVMGHRDLEGKALDVLAPGDFFSPMLIWTKGQVIGKTRFGMTPLDEVLDALEQGILGKTTDPLKPKNRARETPVSRWARPLTSVLSGPWLLVLQDAKRYGLFRFQEAWTPFEQSQPITQRAMRVLVDQHEITPP